MMTLNQFEEAKMKEVCAEYGVSEKEYKEIYESRKQDWMEYLAAEATNGKQFPKSVCRSISDNVGDLGYWQKFFRCIPGDVLLATGRTI